MSWFQKTAQRYFHGTDNEFDISEWSYPRPSFNSNTFGVVETTRHGIFLTDNPDFAKQYGKRLITVTANPQNTATITPDLRHDFTQTIDPFQDRELWLLAKYQRKDWSLFEGELGQRFVAWLKEQGYDSATFPESLDTDSEELHGSTLVVFDPKLLTPV